MCDLGFSVKGSESSGAAVPGFGGKYERDCCMEMKRSGKSYLHGGRRLYYTHEWSR